MQDVLKSALETLTEHREDYETGVKKQHQLWNHVVTDEQPLLLSCSHDMELPAFDFEEIHSDPDKMFANGLRDMYGSGLGRMGGVPSIRANMGCGIFPTMFGVKQAVFPDKMPWVVTHLSLDEARELTKDDIELSADFRKGLSLMEDFAERIAGSGCRVFPMDVQGPFDIAHLVLGDEIFYAMYDDPAVVHHTLDLSVHAIVMGLEECLRRIPGSDSCVCHYNALAMPRSLGGVKLSEDTPTLLAKEHIEEFVMPYSRKVLEHFGGGYVHYCGDNAHLYQAVLAEPLAYGLNFGNPERHDLELVLDDLSARGKVYYGGIPKDEQEDLASYFTRYLQAGKREGSGHLLLQYSCSEADRSAVSDAWQKACETVWS